MRWNFEGKADFFGNENLILHEEKNCCPADVK